MTIQDFKDGFDILYENINSGKAPGLNEYDKSFFLTRAQNEIILNYFNPKSNKLQEGLANSNKRISDFKNLIKTVKIRASLAYTMFYGTYPTVDPGRGIANNTLDFIIPDDSFIPISWYGVKKFLIIKPLTEDEFQRWISKPYKMPFKGYAYLLPSGVWEYNNSIRCYTIFFGNYITITEVTGGDYDIIHKYIRKPNPIITTNLIDVEYEYGLRPSGNTDVSYNKLSIDGKRSQSDCELGESAHQQVLDRAVEMASVYYSNDRSESMLTINSRGE